MVWRRCQRGESMIRESMGRRRLVTAVAAMRLRFGPNQRNINARVSTGREDRRKKCVVGPSTGGCRGGLGTDRFRPGPGTDRFRPGIDRSRSTSLIPNAWLSWICPSMISSSRVPPGHRRRTVRAGASVNPTVRNQRGRGLRPSMTLLARRLLCMVAGMAGDGGGRMRGAGPE